MKRLGSSAGAIPVRQLVAPAGSYRSGGGGDKAVEAFETAGRFGGSASRQAATEVNAVQAPKQPDVEADPVATRGRPPSLGTGGDYPQEFHGGSNYSAPDHLWERNRGTPGVTTSPRRLDIPSAARTGRLSGCC